MPRIEIKPDPLPRNEHDGWPTVDVCMECVENFHERESVPHKLAPEFGRKAEVATIGVEHPPYSDPLGDYKCHCCGKPLTDDDNDPETGTISLQMGLGRS